MKFNIKNLLKFNGLVKPGGFLLFILILLAWFLFCPAAQASKINAPTNFLTVNTGLVGWWTFDGANLKNNVADSSGQNNNGYMKNFTSTSTAVTAGKLGQGLKFDGVNDCVDAGLGTSLNNLGSITISAWVNPRTTGSGATGAVFGKGTQKQLYFNGSGKWRFRLYAGQTERRDSSSSVVLNKWTHITVTWNGSLSATNIHFYTNGVLDDSATTQDGTAPPSDDSIYTQSIGCDKVNSNSYFDGLIDDVRVYNRALTATEIKQLYNMGSTKVNAAETATGGGVTLKTGLVGWWTFDGKDMLNGAFKDMSGHFATGTPMNIATSTFYTAGKMGQAGKFDGVDDYVKFTSTVSSISKSSPFSISLWSKINLSAVVGVTRTIIEQINANDDRFSIVITAGDDTLRSGIYNGLSYFVKKSTTITSNKWHHIVVTFDGNTDFKMYVNNLLADGTSIPGTSGSVGLIIGNRNLYDTSLPGSLDDVRIYNRALSATEIKQLYNMGSTKVNAAETGTGGGTTLKIGLVGWWTFDGKDVTDKVYDRSCGTSCTTGNNGYFIGGATSTAKTAGKLGQGLKFDGVDDWVDTTRTAAIDNLGPSTWSVWVYPTLLKLNNFIIAKGLDSKRLRLLNTTGIVYFDITYNPTSLVRQTTTTVPLNKWTHIVVTWDGTSLASGVHIYLNGVEASYNGAGTNGSTTIISDNGAGFRIGDDYYGTAISKWVGKIDDVRIYNRALSATEVKQLYNLGR